MKISSARMAQIQSSRKANFVARAVKFIRDEYPDIASRGSYEQLVSLINFAMDRAQVYGFVSERDIVKYLTVMIALGTRFDEDERLSELRRPLSGMNQTPPSVRVAILVDLAAEVRWAQHA